MSVEGESSMVGQLPNPVRGPLYIRDTVRLAKQLRAQHSPAGILPWDSQTDAQKLRWFIMAMEHDA